ncbi:hypothetical protein EK21DRAFT_114236 [Setomelanomma holmii]|uniref:DUF7137 domain-containing protein n=1 Tax=Setomelanomma holmii TaxID=210430 RepID=A0A9P4H4P0_9PLEO|nr:hypothetical protein EK21DRAFT_114236 [Setomelanomma holmii]
MSSAVSAIEAFDNIYGMLEAKNVLFGRQDDNSQQSSQAAQSSAAARSSTQPSATNKDNASETNKASGSAKASDSQGTRVTTGKPKSTSFDPRLPAGGITMVTPNAIAGDQFYKVGDWVTFAWNYTSLSVTPSYIDVLASCSANQATYTLAVNMSATNTRVLWDTENTPSGQAPFLTEKYTLMIYDSSSEVTAAPRAGYLGAYSQFTFGMYTPQPYVSWGAFQCANCVKNGALSAAEQMTLKVLLFTTGTTIASLLFFTHNFGLW